MALQNSVANNFDTPPNVALTGASQEISIQDDIGVLSVWVMSDQPFHINKASPATTGTWRVLANTYWEVPVADIKSFWVISDSAGTLYIWVNRG
jgi:hypothetical protein